MKKLYLNWRHCCARLIMFTLCAVILTSCGGVTSSQEYGIAPRTQETPKIQNTQEDSRQIALQADDAATGEENLSDDYWLIEVSDTKAFPYAIPNSGGSIDMNVTLHFIAWKNGGMDMFGQYEGRALVVFDMDLSKVGSGGVTMMGGVMDDSISDNITFEIIPLQQDPAKVEGEDIDLAPLVKFVGQADIITDEINVSQQTWKALADGQIKLDINESFGDGSRNKEGFSLKAGENTVLISVGDFAAAYNLDAFKGNISKTDSESDPLSWFRDKVMSRMEERLAVSDQADGLQSPADSFDSMDFQGALTTDAEGREGFDTNGDGRLEIYSDENGRAYADFDGDGKYEVVGEEGSDN